MGEDLDAATTRENGSLRAGRVRVTVTSTTEEDPERFQGFNRRVLAGLDTRGLERPALGWAR